MRTIAIGSGKGGVGKSSITANLAVILARQGHRVVAMDADFGLANLDVMLGIAAGPTIHDLVEGRNDLDEVLRDHPTGIRILPGCSGVAEMADLDPHKLDVLLRSLHRLESSTDYLLVDVAAGIHEAAVATLGAADEALIVMNEDPASFVDAYATFKSLYAFNPNVSIRVVVNEVADASAGKLLFARMQAIVREHLGISLTYVGSIHRDEEMVRSVRARATVFERSPDSSSSADLLALANALAPNGLRIESRRSSFFSRLLGLGGRVLRAA